MKKAAVVVVMLAMGLSIGAVTASAAEMDCTIGGANSKVVQQFQQETASLSKDLKAKKVELREQFSYDSFDTRTVDELEVQVANLKAQIKQAAQKYGIPSCCFS